MSDTARQPAAEIVPLRQKADKKSEQKWGPLVMKVGFSIVPSLLLRAQRRLHLNPTQLAVLLQIADYWWEAGRKPFPSKQGLADRLGISPRQVQRYIAELEAAGLVQRIDRYDGRNGQTNNEYDLSGLVRRLNEMAPEFLEVEKQAKEGRRRAGQPGLRRRPAKGADAG